MSKLIKLLDLFDPKPHIIAKLSPSPNPSFSWGLRWLYSQLIQPPTHPEKYERAIKTTSFQNKSC